MTKNRIFNFFLIGYAFFSKWTTVQWSILWFMRSKFQNLRIIEYFWFSLIRDFLYIQVPHKISLFAEITLLATDQRLMAAKIGKYRWNSGMFSHNFLGSWWARELKLCRNTPQYAYKTRKKCFLTKCTILWYIGVKRVFGVKSVN